jgi:hypothetical protein
MLQSSWKLSLLFLLTTLLSSILTVTADVGVNDDYYLNIPVTYSCPYQYTDDAYYNLTTNSTATNSTDDYATDDYYGALLPADYPAFTFFYCWMCVITVFPLLYFAYNNKIAPIGEVKPFVPESKCSEL